MYKTTVLIRSRAFFLSYIATSDVLKIAHGLQHDNNRCNVTVQTVHKQLHLSKLGMFNDPHLIEP